MSTSNDSRHQLTARMGPSARSSRIPSHPILPVGVPPDIRPSGRPRLRECFRTNLRESSPAESIRPLLERLLDLLILHLSLSTDNLPTILGKPKQDRNRQRHIPSRTPPVVPRSRITSHHQDPIQHHRNLPPRSLQANDRKSHPPNTLRNPQHARLLQLRLQPLLDQQEVLLPSRQHRLPLPDPLDHKCHLRAKLHRLPDHGHHTLHPRRLARESLPLLHPIGMVGAILGMVLRHGPASDRRRDQHGLRGKSEARDEDLAGDTLSDLDSEHCLDGRRAGDAISLDRLEAAVQGQGAPSTRRAI